jgi:hypothetical protein
MQIILIGSRRNFAPEINKEEAYENQNQHSARSSLFGAASITVTRRKTDARRGHGGDLAERWLSFRRTGKNVYRDLPPA